MIKKVRKGQRLWVVDIHDNEIEIGIAPKNINKIIDGDRIDVNVDAENIIHTSVDDVFPKRKEAVQELIVRLTEKHDHIKEKLSFLNKELDKKGRKTIVLPTHKCKSRFQARTMF